MNSLHVSLALFSSLLFAASSVFFGIYSNKSSAFLVNSIKNVLGLVFISLIIVFTYSFYVTNWQIILVLILSGAIALGYGDILLLKSFANLGSARTFLLFSLHPIFTSILAFLFLSGNHDLSMKTFFACLFFVLCLFVFSFEGIKEKKFKIKYLYYALIAILLDSCAGILIRYSYEVDAKLDWHAVVFYRFLGSIIFLLTYMIFSKKKILSLKGFSLKDKSLLFSACFFGTALSLCIFTYVHQKVNIVILSSLMITSVIFSGAIECIMQKKKPSRNLLVAFMFFVIGIVILRVQM